MKRILLLLSFLLSGQLMMAQCTPDPSVSTWGLHPLPSVGLDGLAAVPEVPACIGEPYSYTFSLVIPSSFDIPGVGSIGVTNAEVTGVNGLPSGLSFGDCSPAGNCVIPGGTTGCFSIIGTPDASNMPGSYEIEITVTVNGTVVVLPQSVDLTFPPDPTFNLFDFPLDPYAIELKSSGECVNSNYNPLESELNVAQNSPNPFSDITRIAVEAKKRGDYVFSVMNTLGEKVTEVNYTLETGENIIEYDGSHLPNGIYMYSLANDSGVITRKMLISK